MARKLIYEVVLDSAAYTRQIKKVQEQTTAFTATVKRTSHETSTLARGAAAGTGVFQKFGRSIAFASGGFLAFQSASAFLTESVSAAREAAVAQRSLAAQMKTSSESFSTNKNRIEEVTHSYARLGFQNDEVIQSLTVLDRATGNITKAIALQGLTANLARAKNIDLAAAASVVGKVFGGQETALRRAVPGLSKTAHGMDLIREAQRRLAGQAVANTTAAEKFSASLHDTQEVIGGLLLPALDKLLGRLTKVTEKMNHFSDESKKAGTPEHNEVQNVKSLGSAFGFVAGKIDQAVGSLGGWLNILPGVNQISQLAAVLRLVGVGGGGRPPVVGPAGLRGPVGTPGRADAVGLQGPVGAAATASTGASVAQRNAWFDAMVGRRELRAGLLAGAAAQLAAYKAIGRILTARIAATHDITRKLNLEDQALQNAATVAGLQVQIAADLKQKQADAAQKIKDAIDAARTEKLGWLDFAIERAQATKTIKDDLAAFRNKEKFLQGLIKKEGRTLELVSELWRVRQQIRDLNKKNGGTDKDPLAGLFQVSSKQLANILAVGTGLGAAGRRQLGFNIAGAEIQPVHVHLNLDGREVASVVTKHQARAGNRTSQQTSGRRG